MFFIIIIISITIISNYVIISQQDLYRVNPYSLNNTVSMSHYLCILRTEDEDKGREAGLAFSINLFARKRLFLPMIYGFSCDASPRELTHVVRESHVSYA